MTLIVKREAERENFAPIEAGMHPAVCYGVVDIGKQPDRFSDTGKETHKVYLLWETAETFKDIDGNDRPRTLSAEYTLSLNEKATLCKTLESWRGRPFTPEELEGFDLKSIIGAPCLLNVQHSVPKSNGRVYANVVGVSPLVKGMMPLKRTLDEVYFVLDEKHISQIGELSEFLQTKIKQSSTYKQIMGGNTANPTSAMDKLQPVEDENLPF